MQEQEQDPSLMIAWQLPVYQRSWLATLLPLTSTAPFQRSLFF
jgi:hypothetical protein